MIYATGAEVAEYTGMAAPADVDRLLERASEEVDYWTRGRVEASNAGHLAAARAAVCAIVESWLANGEPVAAVSGQVQSYTAGKVSVTYAQGTAGSGGRGLPRRAYQALQAVGLLAGGVSCL